MKNIFKTAHRSHNRERRESPQSARYALYDAGRGKQRRSEREYRTLRSLSSVDLGTQRSRSRAVGALPVEHHAQCKMNRDKEQGSFSPWADAGRHNTKQSRDLDPLAARLPAPRRRDEPQDCRRSTHPGRNEPQDCRRSRGTIHLHPTPFDETRLSARNEVPRCQKWEFERRTEMGQTFNDVAWQRHCAISRQSARLKSSPIKPKLPGFHWRLRRWTLSCARELCVQGRANTHKGKTSSKTFIFQCTNPKSSQITDPMGLCPQWPTHAPKTRRGPPR